MVPALNILAPAGMRHLLEPDLPDGVRALWFADHRDALTKVRDAEVAWLDMFTNGWAERITAAIEAGDALKWLSTSLAGIEWLPTSLLAKRRVRVSNGSGLNADAVADFAVMGVLCLAKGLPDLVRSHDRAEWPDKAPGVAELQGSRALVIGYGHIGSRIGQRLEACEVSVTGVRRSAGPGQNVLDVAGWRAQLGSFDWIILAAPVTAETTRMIGKAELAMMRPSAGLINISRGALIDQPALVAALEERALGGAFLDVTDPEPLPRDDPLWTAPNCLVTMHMAGRSQTGMTRRAASLFAENLRRYMRGDALINEVDLRRAGSDPVPVA